MLRFGFIRNKEETFYDQREATSEQYLLIGFKSEVSVLFPVHSGASGEKVAGELHNIAANAAMDPAGWSFDESGLVMIGLR